MASVARGFVYLTYCPLLKFTTNVTNSLGMADLDFQIFFFLALQNEEKETEF